MCGIVGFWNPEGLTASKVKKLAPDDWVQTLIHRGPSAQQHKAIRNRKRRTTAFLGTARLAIVGVDNGSQPVQSPCGRWWVSMNGEIYNHPTLRRECIGNGHKPRNDSDTAVVAALLTFLPLSKVIERLRGMFALAIVDKLTNEVHLLRDRIGQKPLYWMQLDETLFWSSEIRTLQEICRRKEQPLSLNHTAIGHLLCFEYIPAPISIWENIQKLQPGTHLSSGPDKELTIESYWSLPSPTTERGSSRLHWEKSLRLALRSATQLRLQADVDVGTLLSGGIDSTTITRLAAEMHPNIQSFSVGINAKGFSEQASIQENIAVLREQASLRSSVFKFTEQDFQRLMPKIVDHMDEPLADSSLVATWFLFEQIQQQGFKCVLSGDGADEIFAGYPTYRAAQLLQYSSKLPSLGLRRKIRPLINRLPAKPEGVSFEEMAKRFCSINADHSMTWWQEHQMWMGAWTPDQLLLNGDIWNIAEEWSQKAQSDRIGNAMFMDHRLYLSEGVLTKVDRASMAHGIEVRSPFVDHHIVELAAKIPMQFKLNHRGNKQILRSLLPALPTNIQHRPKKGFGSPVAQWMFNSHNTLLDDLPEILSTWLPTDLVQQTIREHKEGSHNHRRRLWSGLMLAEWLARHG